MYVFYYNMIKPKLISRTLSSIFNSLQSFNIEKHQKRPIKCVLNCLLLLQLLYLNW